MYYLGLLLEFYVLTTFLQSTDPKGSKTLLIFVGLALCIPIIFTGIAIQSKLVILATFIYVFAAIQIIFYLYDALGFIFPFWIFSGLLLVYVGLSFEKYEIGDPHDYISSILGMYGDGHVQQLTDQFVTTYFPNLHKAFL
eukprot:TRINITY_DN11027_c0_g1_i2.p1 TRINITY_DN11027_c0_g1~~TRINITY_DN11027_c0_g1_i2.p1  ORF type:complete len:140 (-),score=24.90 TRINITY_DN11027_c0_g1_i2:26-445(-)